jgi:hypothetical protein
MTPNPVPTTTPPPHNNNARFYYESYVAQDPSWNLIATGWVGGSGTVSQAYGAGTLLAATYNLPVQTRVWDEDVGAWGGWVEAVPAGGPPDKGTLPVTPPAPAVSSNALGVAAGVVLGGLVAFLVWPR